MSSITVVFTRPITHSLSDDELTATFEIMITGPRDSYSLIWSLDTTTLKRNEYSTSATFKVAV